MARTLHLVGKIVVNCLACLLCDFEANRSRSFALTDGCSIERIPMRRHVSDFQADNITSSKFAVDGQVKQREIPNTVRQLKARSNRPDVLWAERWSRSDELALVPRLTNLVMGLAASYLVHRCFSFCLEEKSVRPIQLLRLASVLRAKRITAN